MPKQSRKTGNVSRRKPGRPIALLGIPHESIERMLTAIRVGAFAWVAARLIGIDSRTFCRWMSEGSNPESSNPEYRRFYLAVSEAYSIARLNCEQRVFESDPQFWLSRGPGRTLDPLLEPGWTEPPKEGVSINIDNRTQELSIESTQETQAPLVFSQALQVLSDLGIVQVSDAKLLESKPSIKAKPIKRNVPSNGYDIEPFVN